MKNRLIVLISAILPLAAYSQSAYDKGWDSFLNNKGAEAREYFNQAAADKQTSSDAYLSLALLDEFEGKTEQAFQNLSKSYDGTPKANALLYASSHMPFAFTSRAALEQDKLAFLQKLEKSPVMNGYLKTVIDGALGYHYMGLNDFETAKKYFRAPGVLYDWEVLGSFDNTSGGGFNKNWGAVEKAKTSDKFEGITGAQVSWFYPGVNQLDGWYRPDFYVTTSDAIIYAQTFVTSPDDREVILSVGVSGSLKAWVNDALVLSVESERNCGTDLYGAKVKLNKGANRILLQLGAGEVSTSNFYARLVDGDGYPVLGLGHSHQYAQYTKDASTQMPAMLEFYPEKEISQLIASDSGNMLYRIMLAEQYLIADKTDEAIELLTALQEQNPGSSLLHIKLSEGYVRSQNQTYATRETEAVKTKDPDSFWGMRLLISEAQGAGKISDVKKMLKKLVDAYGRNEFAIDVEEWLASQENDSKKVLELAREQYRKHPEDYSKMNDLYRITENTLKDTKAAKKIIEDYNKKYYNESAAQVLASIYMKEGGVDKALKLYEERIKKHPYASGYYLGYAQVLFNMQRYDKALAVGGELLKLVPYQAVAYFFIANTYKEKGDKANAVANYEKALYYFPGHFNSLQQLRLLDAKKEFEEYFPENDLEALIAKAGSAADYPEDNSIIVTLSEDILYHPGGANESRTQLAVKILNQAGVDTWKEYMVTAYTGQNITLDKMEVIKPNGQKVKAEADNGHIVFTGLEIGDVLHLNYRTKTYYYGKLSRMFDGGCCFRYTLPTMHVRHMMAMPRDMKFTYKFVNGELDPVVSEQDDRILYKWELTDQASVKAEPVMPSLQDVAPTLLYSNYPDWKFVREWYQDVTANKFRADYVLKSTIAQILKGSEDASDLKKAKLFYEYIIKNTSYLNATFMQDNQIPQKASRTLSTHLGDCKDVATLFTAMCRESGIDANVALVLTRNNADNTLTLPSNAFNHAMAELSVDGKHYLLELTSNYLPFGAMFAESLTESKLLSIREPGAGTQDVLKTVSQIHQIPNIVVRSKTVELEDDDYKVDFLSMNYGSRGAYMRESYADMGAEERKKSFSEVAASDYRTRVTLSGLEFRNLDNLADSVVYRYKVVAENIVQNVTDMKIFKLVWTDSFGTLEELALETRKYPFLNWAYYSGDKSIETIEVKIPEGMELAEKPADVVLDCANASYSVRFDTSKKGILKAVREFTPKTGLVSVEEYPAFNKFMYRVLKNDDKTYVIKKKR